MFRHGTCSTEVDKKPFLFTLLACLGSLTAAVLAVVLSRGQALAVFAAILLAIVAVAAGAVLFAMVSDRAYVRDGVLTVGYLFRRAEIPLEQIDRLVFKEDVYSVYDRKGALVGTINAKLTGIDTVLNMLDRSGVRFV
jgi:hypothetical protein